MMEGIFQFMGQSDIVKATNAVVEIDKNIYIALFIEIASGIRAE